MDKTSSNTDPSDGLFADETPVAPTVARIRLTDYLRWAAGSDDARGNGIKYPLALPPIQRGFVWKHWQIAELWDSILRKMPIGSFMLTKHNKGDDEVSLQPKDRKNEKATKPGFGLLDGQQRTLAMLIGWPGGDDDPDRRIWVDLGEDGENGARFMLRVTTKSQPFGFRSGRREKLSRDDRKKARERFDAINPGHEKKRDYELSLDMTLPWKPDEDSQRFLVPIREVWRLFRHVSGDEWEEKVIAEYLAGCGPKEETRDRIKFLGSALLALDRTWVALLLVPDLNEPHGDLTDAAHDPLNMLFERISSNGTRLSPEDLLFSMIKQVYPESHDLVYEIHKEVGRLMTAPDYVMTALRLARAGQDGDDNANPSAKEFHRFLKDPSLLAKQPLGALRRLIEPAADGGENSLVRAFMELIDLLAYGRKLDGQADPGLPQVLMPYLGRPLLQILLCWLVPVIDSGAADQKLLDDSRDELLRFVLFWLLCKRDAKTSYLASKKAFEYLRRYQEEIKARPFPGKELYNEIVRKNPAQDQLFISIAVPDALEKSLNVTPQAKWRTMIERFKEKTDQNLIDLFERFWGFTPMLLWLQRDWLGQSETFPDYKPLAGRDENDKDSVPYDFDHLVPQAHWSDMRSSVQPHSKVIDDAKAAFEKRWIRRELGNAIGNFRIIGSSENRARGDKPLTDELHLDKKPDTSEWRKYAFAPTPDELKWWLTASPSQPEEDSNQFNRIWDEERLKAFQAAVEHRTIFLYRRLYDDAGFANWCDDPSE